MKLGIIGGGAAGLMAAAAAHEADPLADIFLIERNAGVGKKVIISGGGRCNVTTGISDIRTVLTNYPRGGRFLSSAMYRFSPEQVYAWFEAHGVPLKIEDDLRVFPGSDDGHDIVRVFEKMFHDPRMHVLLRTSAQTIQKNDHGFQIRLKDHAESLFVDRLVLTTGGQAYRHTGSTGDGYAFAESLGHSITTLAPSLNSFFTRETWPKELSGLSFVKATLSAKREKYFSYTGPFLFTHTGVSGPAVFALSSLLAFESYDKENPLEISIDVFPDDSLDEVRSMLEASLSMHPKKSFINCLAGMIPRSLVGALCRELHLPDKKAAEFAKIDILRVVRWLKGIPLHVIARGAGDEFVTAGGVELAQVDPTTMESRLCSGLFFAGELLDIDGFTGGFNLQASWATGHLAGECVVRP